MLNSRWPGLKDLTPGQRLDGLLERTGLEPDALDALRSEAALSISAADLMAENVVGVMGIPLGIAPNFIIDGVDYVVPMATEEPSVVAAASNAARIAREAGGFTTTSTGPVMQAQIQLAGISNPHGAAAAIREHREELIEAANAIDPVLVRLGGGCLDVITRIVPTSRGTYVVAHLVVDVRDAMGANAVNTMAERLAPRLAEITGGAPVLRILTNKADRRLVTARAVFPASILGGDEVVESILDAATLAVADPYRAATHNKGIMNGVSAVVLATGNDTRAVEAGAHAHAAKDGQYTALSHFERTPSGDVEGTIEIPMPVGLVGGATRSHPVAQAALKILAPESADALGRIIAAVGLAQNFAGLRVLATEGVQRGHMTLHARTVATSAGATPDEVAETARRMVEAGVVRSDKAEEILAELRGSAQS